MFSPHITGLTPGDLPLNPLKAKLCGVWRWNKTGTYMYVANVGLVWLDKNVQFLAVHNPLVLFRQLKLWQRWTNLCGLLQYVWLSHAIWYYNHMLMSFPFILHWVVFYNQGNTNIYIWEENSFSNNRDETIDICKWGCRIPPYHIAFLWILVVTVPWQLYIITCSITASWTFSCTIPMDSWHCTWNNVL